MFSKLFILNNQVAWPILKHLVAGVGLTGFSSSYVTDLE